LDSPPSKLISFRQIRSGPQGADRIIMISEDHIMKKLITFSLVTLAMSVLLGILSFAAPVTHAFSPRKPRVII
ncbi:MAG: hypothetical protein ILO53_04645, partial [Clostridia bacterium]|nr:hypothetical protein [Clostridia bacterium]